MLFISSLTKKLQRFFLNLSIKFKIIFIFTVFIFIYAIAASLLYTKVFNTQKITQLRQSSFQSIDLMKSSIDANIETINNVSKLIISDPSINNYLKTAATPIALRKKATQTLTNLYVTFPFIDSIYIYHFDGSNINASQSVTYSLIDELQAAPWYKKVISLKGSYFITINAQNTLLPNTRKNNISLMRVVYDINDILPIGILVINISQDFFSPIIEEVQAKYGSSFVLIDGNNNPIIKTKEPLEMFLSKPYEAYSEGTIEKMNGSKYFVLASSLPQYDWKIISYTALNPLNNTLNAFMSTLILLALITIIIFLSASLFTANLVTWPIKNLITCMQGVKKGHFKPVDIAVGNDEIGELKATYNIMIHEIEKMIKHEVQIEKQKRKYELDILNEQIKPHFLYNTLDSIGYLILSNNNKDAYTAVNALGQFYKSSLNKGKETHTLKEEILIIKNYLIIQKFRYGSILADSYDLSPETLSLPILKNSLQPLVENCIYHGIKPSGEPGNILITSSIKENKLYITVEDDGLGMTKEKMQHLEAETLDRNTASFGLRGTISRLKIYYESNDVYDIISEPFKGTVIILKIPIKEAI
ncbi:histidine kinase [Sporanaerobium hydrogeniformans]|uniref:Histidine kinase n=1 Tax=Sporanaerobium hydrogeniformans TaxID=3072179 RepID=A0AC61D9X6_9FIRM|nr:sensor histidine kinase [Sporanaerobium hydrogeniformans]PHV69347.1 histidine kinase [Sporanaerobium hydrogeniformans]